MCCFYFEFKVDDICKRVFNYNCVFKGIVFFGWVIFECYGGFVFGFVKIIEGVKYDLFYFNVFVC